MGNTAKLISASCQEALSMMTMYATIRKLLVIRETSPAVMN